MPYRNPYNSYNMRVRKEGLGYTVRNRALVPKFRSPELARAINEATESLREARFKAEMQEKVKLNLSNKRHNSIDAPILIKGYTILEGPCKITKANGNNNNMLELFSNLEERIVLRDLELDGNRDNCTAGHGIYFDSFLGIGEYWYNLIAVLENIRVDECDDDGIHLETASDKPASYMMDKIVSRTNSKRGLYMKHITDSFFMNLALGGGQENYYGYQCSACWFTQPTFGGCATGFSNVYLWGGVDQNFWNFYNDQAKRHGFHFYGGAHHTVANGRITDYGYEANNTYDGIFMEAGSDMGIYNNLKIYSDEENKPRYGINESDAASNYNVYSNMVITNYVTAGIKISGANSKADADAIIGTIV